MFCKLITRRKYALRSTEFLKIHAWYNSCTSTKVYMALCEKFIMAVHILNNNKRMNDTKLHDKSKQYHHHNKK